MMISDPSLLFDPVPPDGTKTARHFPFYLDDYFHRNSLPPVSIYDDQDSLAKLSQKVNGFNSSKSY
jgi:hypothetical protein